MGDGEQIPMPSDSYSRNCVSDHRLEAREETPPITPCRLLGLWTTSSSI